jgi:hypothetical protein
MNNESKISLRYTLKYLTENLENSNLSPFVRRTFERQAETVNDILKNEDCCNKDDCQVPDHTYDHEMPNHDHYSLDSVEPELVELGIDNLLFNPIQQIETGKVEPYNNLDAKGKLFTEEEIKTDLPWDKVPSDNLFTGEIVNTEAAETFIVRFNVWGPPESIKEATLPNGVLSYDLLMGMNNRSVDNLTASDYHRHYVTSGGTVSFEAGNNDTVVILGHTTDVSLLNRDNGNSLYGVYSNAGWDNIGSLYNVHDLDTLALITIHGDPNIVVIDPMRDHVNII